MNNSRLNQVGDTAQRLSVQPRLGFTLVELLLVIAIISVLAALSLGVLRSASEDARAAATQTRVQLIESMLQREMEDYQVRRLPISNDILIRFVVANRIDDGTNPPVPIGVQVRNLRRRIMSEVIRTEIASWYLDGSNNFANNPDLGVFPTRNSAALGSAPFNLTFKDWLDSANPIYGYDQRININGTMYSLSEWLEERIPSRVRHWQQFNNAINPSVRNANFDLPGEYMYRILELIDVDGTSGIDVLGPAAVGDPDGDGNPDIVDDWGESMQLRILQVQLSATPGEVRVGEDIYTDVPNTDWTDYVGGLPLGYAVVNPIVPRPVNKIRVQVVSPKLDSRN